MLKGEVINQLEETISINKRRIELNDSLNRLKSNPDFINIVQKIYFGKHAVELVMLRGASDVTEADAKAIDLDIIAIGRFNSFLENIRILADSANYTIEQCRDQVVQLETSTDETDEGDE